MTPASLDSATSDIRQFLRAHFPTVAYGIQPIGPDVPSPLKEETHLLSPNAVLKRRLEFAAGRHAARVALRTLGRTPMAIGKGDFGQPLWPEGVLGSITHTEHLALALTTTDSNANGIGLDLELVKRFRPDLAEAVLTPSELEKCERQIDLAAYFSAKEATYKAIFPTLGKVVGFQDVELSFTNNGKCFSAAAVSGFSTLFPQGESFLQGRVLATEGMILSVAVFG